MKCGTKLPDDAKFCYKCGARVPAAAAGGAAEPEAVPEQDGPALPAEAQAPAETAQAPQEAAAVPAPAEENLPDVPGSHAVILAKYHIDFPRPLALRRQLWAPFNREGERQYRLVYHSIKEHFSSQAYTEPSELMKDLTALIFDACNPSFDAAVETLIDHGVDVVSKDNLVDEIFKQYQKTDLFKGVLEDERAIARYLQQLGEEKEMNKAHWQGGGFGITGAITGAVKAGMLNMAQDGLSSLGRAITGNTYSGRAQKFIRQRLDRRNYANMGANIAESIISVWLVNILMRTLVNNHKLPPFAFQTQEVKNRLDNIKAMVEKGRYSKDTAMQALCDSLAQTGDSAAVYRAMAELEPEAIPDILQVADSEGAALSLAGTFWNQLHQSGSLAFPDWVQCFGFDEGYAIRSSAEMAALRYLMKEYPEGYDENRIILINASNLTIPFYEDLEHVSYYGFGEDLQFSCASTEPIDFAAGQIRFYHICFAPPYADVAASQVENFKADARKAQDQGNLKQAAASYQAAADMGDTEAMYRLGLAFRDLDEYEEACKWLTIAAELGETRAAWEFYQMNAEKGIMFYNYLLRAAEGENGKACLKAGEMYETGTGAKDGKDFGKAAEYYAKAAALGEPGAEEALERAKKAAHTPEFQQILFKNYQKYKESDETKALDYLRRSASLGCEEARRVLSDWDLAKAGELRKDEKSDWPAVCDLYEEAADCGSMEGCYELALLKESGKGTDADPEGAAKLILKAAQGGYGPACVRAGEDETKAGHAEAAFEWYQKGVEAGEPRAFLQAGLCYETGEGCAKDLEKARDQLSKALELDVAEAREPLQRVNMALGDELRVSGRCDEALACYEAVAKEEKNAEAMLKAAALRGNKDLDSCYDYVRAMAWYDLASTIQPATEETKAARICLKASGSYAESLAYLKCKYGTALKGSHYHLGDDISDGLLDNAMKAYGSRLGVDRSEVFLVCDASNALLWGKGKKGFILTEDGDVYTSQGETASLDDFCRVSIDSAHALKSDTGFIFCVFEKDDCGSLDEHFASWLSEEAILTQEESDLAEARGVFADEEDGTEPETRDTGESAETEDADNAAAAEAAEAGTDSGNPPAAEVEPKVQAAPPAAEAEPEVQTAPAAGPAGRFCPRCGAPVKPDARFCTSCGMALTDAAVPAAPAAEPAASGGSGREALLAFTQQLARQLDGSHTYLYCAPEIPSKKLANALSSYAAVYAVDPQDILVLCDKTITGTGRDGFLLTWNALISSENGSFALKDIKELEPSTSIWTGKITLQPGNRTFISIAPDKELTAFCEGMNKLLKG